MASRFTASVRLVGAVAILAAGMTACLEACSYPNGPSCGGACKYAHVE
jgi:hypothetical protein